MFFILLRFSSRKMRGIPLQGYRRDDEKKHYITSVTKSDSPGCPAFIISHVEHKLKEKNGKKTSNKMTDLLLF